MNSIIKGALAALALGTALPALATTAPGGVTFNFDSSTDSSLTGTAGNPLTFSTKAGGTTYWVQASAWEIDDKGAISRSYLGDYTHGLGSTNKDDNGGLGNEHEIDNLHGTDFIVLQFDHAVTLTSASLTPFNLYYFLPNDTDATYSYATTSTAWNKALSMSGQVMGDLSAHALSVAGNGSAGAVAMNGAGNSGNVWVIGADISGIDCNYDGFKLSSVTVNEVPAAVPEPATWATMLIGFGAVGSSMRRRSTRRAIQAV